MPYSILAEMPLNEREQMLNLLASADANALSFEATTEGDIVATLLIPTSDQQEEVEAALCETAASVRGGITSTHLYKEPQFELVQGEVKTARWTIRLIEDIWSQRCKAIIEGGECHEGLYKFVFHYFTQRFGLGRIVESMLSDLIYNTQRYSYISTVCEMFITFLKDGVMSDLDLRFFVIARSHFIHHCVAETRSVEGSDGNRYQVLRRFIPLRALPLLLKKVLYKHPHAGHVRSLVAGWLETGPKPGNKRAFQKQGYVDCYELLRYILSVYGDVPELPVQASKIEPGRPHPFPHPHVKRQPHQHPHSHPLVGSTSMPQISMQQALPPVALPDSFEDLSLAPTEHHMSQVSLLSYDLQFDDAVQRVSEPMPTPVSVPATDPYPARLNAMSEPSKPNPDTSMPKVHDVASIPFVHDISNISSAASDTAMRVLNTTCSSDIESVDNTELQNKMSRLDHEVQNLRRLQAKLNSVKPVTSSLDNFGHYTAISPDKVSPPQPHESVSPKEDSPESMFSHVSPTSRNSLMSVPENKPLSLHERNEPQSLQENKASYVSLHESKVSNASPPGCKDFHASPVTKETPEKAPVEFMSRSIFSQQCDAEEMDSVPAELLGEGGLTFGKDADDQSGKHDDEKTSEVSGNSAPVLDAMTTEERSFYNSLSSALHQGKGIENDEDLDFEPAEMSYHSSQNDGATNLELLAMSDSF
eukprot:TRINITY_DN37103_c0_g1_i1.p1 TRINITY_DN37103_c0_g1~~TRINITY_DN37103_c0_g1_i1.p1  ORF type:complete len:702 (+),score=98.09 TRINITY_DN37103_c0_g1_i1:44-2149(+)